MIVFSCPSLFWVSLYSFFIKCADSSSTAVSGHESCMEDTITRSRGFVVPSSTESEESILRELYELVASGTCDTSNVGLQAGLDRPNNEDFLELDDLFPVCDDENGVKYKDTSVLTNSDLPQDPESVVFNVLQRDDIIQNTPEVTLNNTLFLFKIMQNRMGDLQTFIVTEPKFCFCIISARILKDYLFFSNY